MKASILSVLALSCMVAMTMAMYDYTYTPYYGGASSGFGDNQFLMLLGLLVLLSALFMTSTTNNTKIINLTAG